MRPPTTDTFVLVRQPQRSRALAVRRRRRRSIESLTSPARLSRCVHVPIGSQGSATASNPRRMATCRPRTPQTSTVLPRKLSRLAVRCVGFSPPVACGRSLRRQQTVQRRMKNYPRNKTGAAHLPPSRPRQNASRRHRPSNSTIRKQTHRPTTNMGALCTGPTKSSLTRIHQATAAAVAVVSITQYAKNPKNHDVTSSPPRQQSWNAATHPRAGHPAL